jgi:predicted N-acetyltransferase YhbS
MTTYQVRPAADDDRDAIIGLIDEAARWLQRTKKEDAAGQWVRPWPNERDRDKRIVQGIRSRSTWMVEYNGTLAGTITYRKQGSKKLWYRRELAEPSVYISRLIVSHKFAGRRIGAALIDWAGMNGMAAWKAEWVRVDVWTDNLLLHGYYKEQGFDHVRTCAFEDPWEYPSAALFQKPTADIGKVTGVSFEKVS